MRLRHKLSLPEPDRQGELVLRDGRHLAYCEWGAPTGMPVMHMHGMPDLRLELHAPAEYYEQARIRLITVDRPGYGGSERKPRRTLLDWPGDVRELADALGIARFAITAQSGGGPFALACAYAIPERVARVAIAGCMGPLDRPGAMRGIKLLNRAGLWLAAHSPWALAGTNWVLDMLLQMSPDAFLARDDRWQARQ